MAQATGIASNEAVALAFDVLGISRQLLLVRMRFMEPAFYRLNPVIDFESTLWVDGNELHFSPMHVIGRYLQDELLVSRDYLHVVLHCVFQHPFVSGEVVHDMWDLACDIAVESLISSLNLDAARTSRDAEQADIVARLRNKVGMLSAERIYRYLKDAGIDQDGLTELSRRFYADDHGPWYEAKARRGGGDREEGSDEKSSADDEDQGEQDSTASAGKQSEQRQTYGGKQDQSQEEGERGEGSPKGTGQGGRDEARQDGEQGQQGREGEQNPSTDQRREGERQSSSGGNASGQRGGCEGDGGSGRQQQADLAEYMDQGEEDPRRQEGDKRHAPSARNRREDDSIRDGVRRKIDVRDDAEVDPDQTLQDWQNIAEHLEVELETMGKQEGLGTRDLVEAIRALNRQSYDYEEFLRRFAVTGEVMTVNPDEFDYIYYTYGLKLYDNVPLIEPLEYREVKRINEFVIAIDTSASTNGSQVQSFVEKTFNMLKQSESFFTKVKIYVVQCDSRIKDVQVVTSLDEVDGMVANLKLHGFGGTDFRPVFEYVDELIEQHELIDLKGLIYFTDGFGEYPSRIPSYKTAFVFVDDGQINPDVPPWAIKLILSEEDL